MQEHQEDEALSGPELQQEEPLSEGVRRSRREVMLMAFIFVFFFAILLMLLPTPPGEQETNFCPQVQALEPRQVADGTFHNVSRFFSNEYANKSADQLAGALRIPTVSLDEMLEDPSKDERFNPFGILANYLETQFPLCRKRGRLEYINTHAMLYTFRGSRPHLKPVMLSAHLDVGPVNNNTLDQWDHPPFSGFFDGSYIHGRGSVDSKSSLLAILEATEALLAQNWAPERTLLLAFGYDAEIGGTRGAKQLAREIKRRYGPDPVELIVDEGAGVESWFGSSVALPAIAEKGHVDFVVQLKVPGGHSSTPPDHTAIGLVAQLIEKLEENPMEPVFSNSNPALQMFRCLAEHSLRMDKNMRSYILDIHGGGHRESFVEMLNSSERTKFLLRNSQAVDVIRGGVKRNALPEFVEVKINHRITLEDSVYAIKDRIEHMVLKIAEAKGFQVLSDGAELATGSNGVLTITSLDPRDASPISPYWGEFWNTMSATTRHIFEVVNPFEMISDPFVFATSTLNGNTDTCHYWDISRAIYRFTPGLAQDSENVHTVNERLRFRSHLSAVAWYYEFIINSTD